LLQTAADIFGTPPSITLPQELARAALIFFYVLILLRIAGPRTTAKFSSMDMLASVIAGSSLSRALTGNAPLFGTLAAIAFFVALHWLFTQGAARSTTVLRILEAKPVELSSNGEILGDKLRSRGVSTSDFETALRDAGVAELGEQQRATLEPNGRITVWPRG
jgi:uncharacterized membrane protein YcaP (DUF421 family)